MQVNPINNSRYNPKFTAYFRMPFDQESFEFLEKSIKPLYKIERGQDIAIYLGEHPFQPLYKISLMQELSESPYSSEWMRANAEMYGADFSEIDKQSILVVTTNKDTQDLFLYIKERLKNIVKSNNFFGKIKRIIEYTKNPVINENIPDYLVGIFCTLRENSKELAQFKKYMDNKNVETANSFFEICSMIMRK